MAYWTTITETATDPDAPVTSSLIKALRDNPQAIAEGASGAPRIEIGAMMQPTSGTTNVIARMRSISASDGQRKTSDILNVVVSGTVTLDFDYSVLSGRIEVHRVSSSDVVVFSTASGTLPVSFSVTRGQYLYIEAVNTGSGTTFAENIVFYSGSNGGILS